MSIYVLHETLQNIEANLFLNKIRLSYENNNNNNNMVYRRLGLSLDLRDSFLSEKAGTKKENYKIYFQRGRKKTTI